jgi:hypothetical protein
MSVPRLLAKLLRDSGRRSGTTVRKPVRVHPSLDLLECRLRLAEAGQVDFKAASTFLGGSGNNHAVVNGHNLAGVQPTLVNFR